MKNWFCLLVFLFLSSFALYGQNVYQHFSELKGMEDYNGNTNLLYRIYSYSYYSYGNYSSNNHIHLLNVPTLTDSIFQRDYSSGSEYTGDYSRSVIDYKFWDNDPSKFIVCGVYSGTDPEGFIEGFDGIGYYPFAFYFSFVGISQQNDSLIYSVGGYSLIKSTSGGKDWNTTGNFNAISLSPYNDKVLFAVEDGKLFKTSDGGLTKIPVDTIYSTTYMLYDKDTNYIYRVFNNEGRCTFLVSNNAGSKNSWQDKFRSTLPIYLSPDYSNSGLLYMATGKNIYYSTDFGNTFSLFKSFERNLVGIYKKPGSSKLYTATYNCIYEIDGSIVNIIKQIPIDKEIFKFDPLDVGNKWVYNVNEYRWYGGVNYNTVSSIEIIKDTLLPDHQLYKQINSRANTLFRSPLTYVRIDSATGKVYFWDSGVKGALVVDDLSITIGDTIFSDAGPIFFDSITTKSIFGLQKENHFFSKSFNYVYSFTKDFGLTFEGDYSIDEDIFTYNLKGAIIKGVVYGDTSFVVGINDKDPVQSKEFALMQNYPNPFNPSTTIKFSLPKAGNVKLTIYNAIGSKVTTLIDEYKTAGNYSVQFNGSNLASGIYLYRLESGNYSDVKKFILLK